MRRCAGHFGRWQFHTLVNSRLWWCVSSFLLAMCLLSVDSDSWCQISGMQCFKDKLELHRSLRSSWRMLFTLTKLMWLFCNDDRYWSPLLRATWLTSLSWEWTNDRLMWLSRVTVDLVSLLAGGGVIEHDDSPSMTQRVTCWCDKVSCESDTHCKTQREGKRNDFWWVKMHKKVRQRQLVLQSEWASGFVGCKRYKWQGRMAGWQIYTTG